MRLSIRTKLLTGMLAGIAFLVVSLSFVMYRGFAEASSRELLRELAAAMVAYERFDAERMALLLSKARAVGRMPYVMATLSIPGLDQPTVVQALQPLRTEIGTDLLLLLDAEGRLLGDGTSDATWLADLAATPGVAQAMEGKEFIGAARIRGQYYQIAVSPLVEAQQLMGIAITGTSLEAAQAARLAAEVTGMDASYVFHDSPGAMQLTPPQALLAGPAELTHKIENGRLVRQFAAGGENIYAGDLPIAGLSAWLVLQRGDGPARRQWQSLFHSMLLFAAIAVAISVAICVWLAGRVSRPIRQLAAGRPRLRRRQLLAAAAGTGLARVHRARRCVQCDG